MGLDITFFDDPALSLWWSRPNQLGNSTNAMRGSVISLVFGHRIVA